ncbi:MAG: hypothetical protein ACK539_04205 [Planctomycetota bacterium]
MPSVRTDAGSACTRSPPTRAASRSTSRMRPGRMPWGGIEQLLDQVVRPALAGLPQADVELWIAAKIDGVGWRAAGAAAGMDKAAIERTRRRITRFLSAEDVLRRLLHRLEDVP